ncbi:MAG: FtsQ-type POTRA domain-containing protein, partial [Actinobacteria bacterium]|nr:FtsQ-type POTRA domain-containing protein [Actinomycetota bacterium]
AGVPAAAGSGADRPAGPASPAPPRSHWKAVFFLAAFAAIAVAVGWALLGSQVLIVRSVQVTGTGPLVPRPEVTAAAHIRRGVPLIRVDTAAVARRVERITQVRSAEVSRDWPDRITITVRQRTPVFAVADGSGYDLVDEFGVAVTRAARRPARLPVLLTAAPGTSLRGSPAVRAAAAVLRELPATIGRRVRSVAAPSAQEVSVQLTGGVTVVWGGPGRAAQKAKELAILMRVPARRYDVSGPGAAMTQG